MCWEGHIERVLKDAIRRIQATRLVRKDLTREECLNFAHIIFFKTIYYGNGVCLTTSLKKSLLQFEGCSGVRNKRNFDHKPTSRGKHLNNQCFQVAASTSWKMIICRNPEEHDLLNQGLHSREGIIVPLDRLSIVYPGCAGEDKGAGVHEGYLFYTGSYFPHFIVFLCFILPF